MFEIEIAVRSKKDIAPADLIGKAIDLELEVSQGGFGEEPVRRCWNGLVTELHEGPAVTRGLRSYHLVVRPALWLLSQTRDSRIWMDQSTLDVLDTLLKEHGLIGADTRGVLKPAPPLHYSCQFNESDLRYLLRRFEEDGYFYWFSHAKGSHRLHVANHVSGWLKPSEAAQGDNGVRLALGSSDVNHINEWKRRFTYVPGTRSGADWNYKTFGQIPLTSTPSLVELPGNAKREIFEWPARAMDLEETEQSQKLRMQASEADHERVSGMSTVRILEPGRRFKPYDAANPDARFEEHVVITAEHSVIDRSYETDGGSLPEYRNRFEAIPARVPLTPHRTTPRPKIEGLQVAVVAGPEGEEIHCDSEGCVKLWFPWQRQRAKKDGTDTKWIRVSTNWAGQGWGGQVIPRIGMEVLVAFLDSDPDRPIVTGLVPNPKNKVPYPLPENKTKTVFRTNTHKSKNNNQFNEISLEDDIGREEVFIRAQKDRNEKILNNHTEQIDNNWVQSIGNDKAIHVVGNHDEFIGRNMTINVGPSRLFNFFDSSISGLWNGIGSIGNKISSYASKIPSSGNLHVFVQNSMVKFMGLNYIINVARDMVVSVGGNRSEAVDGALEVSVGGMSTETVNGIKVIQSDEHIDLEAGGSSIHMYKDGTIVIDGKRLFIDIEGEVEINGQRVNIN